MPLRRFSPLPISNDAISALQNEVMEARFKFPVNKQLTVALMEEVGELAKAELQKESNERIKSEALQVACVAMRIYEETDADMSCDLWYSDKKWPPNEP